MKRFILNPIKLFFLTWSMVITLFSLGFSEGFLTPSKSFWFFSAITGLSAYIGFFVGHHFLLNPYWKPCVKQQSGFKELISLVQILFGIIVFILVIEIVYSGGFPLLWKVTDPTKVYIDYGIPTLHGFFNAMVFFEGTICFWLFLVGCKSQLVRFVFVIIIFLQVMFITRFVLMTLLVQCFFIFVSCSITLRKRHIIFALIVVLLFGGLGIIRTDSDFIRTKSELKIEREWMPTVLLWPYMYMVTPINNFVSLTQTEFDKRWGYETISKFTPTVFRKHLQKLMWNTDFSPAPTKPMPIFNVGTYAYPLYLDIGWYGVIGFTFLSMLLAGFTFRRYLRRNSLYDLMFLVVANQVIVFSFFDNLLLLWGVFFQFIIIAVTKKYTVNTIISNFIVTK